MLPKSNPMEKATITIDFPLENSQAAERKRDELEKARDSIPIKTFVTSAERSDEEDQTRCEPFLEQQIPHGYT